MKIACYGVRETEKQFFLDLNKKFNFELVLVQELLTHDNINTFDGCDAVMLRANCVTDKQNLDAMKAAGVQYVLTRTVGVNHIDVNYAKEIGMKTARVPFYSPNAVSELAFSMGNAMLRNLFYSAHKSGVNKDFRVDNFMFAKEVRNSVIGVIGTGRIGYEAAKAWKGMGATVLGYDLYPNDKLKEVLTYVELDELLSKADLITLHCPYIPGENDHMVNDKFISKMKDGSFIVNAARGELLDPKAVYNAIKSGKIKGLSTDVVEQESKIFFKDLKGKAIEVEDYEKLWSLYPQVVITPHIGSYTDEAVKNMVETSYENLKEYIETGNCKNII